MINKAPTDGSQPAKAPRWELKFSTRIALLFGMLGMVAISVVMIYSVSMAQNNLQAEINNSLTQHQRTIVSLIDTRLKLLEVYLHSASARRTVTALSERTVPVDQIAADVAFMFQDANIDSSLEVFFLLDPEGKLVMDAGLPLYDIGPLLAVLRSPIHYANRWSLVASNDMSALIKATPIFDPATVQLRGYLFVGLALGQNRAFMRELERSTHLDLLILGHRQQALAWQDGDSDLPAGEPPEALPVDRRGLYVQRFDITLGGTDEPFWLELGLSDQRFASVYASYLHSFLLLSAGFLALLLAAAWLLRVSHDRAIRQLLDYIGAIQAGRRGAHFQPSGIYEYNRVGFAMQAMVEDLHVAATVFDSAEGMVVTDAERAVLRVNQAFTRITGYSAADVIGKPLEFMHCEVADGVAAALDKDGAWQGEMLGQRKNGQEYPQWVSITAVYSADGRQLINYVVTLNDTTQRKAAEHRIEQLAFYDPLTNLPNRRLQLDRLKKALLTSAASEQYGAILFIDLDDFKTLNDTRGHDIGDQLLQQVALRLSANVRASDSVARIGGDEFVVLLEALGQDMEGASLQAQAISSKLLHALRQPFRILELEHFSTLSIGISLFYGCETPVDDLLKQADLAMYQAKAEGRNTQCFFDPQMQARVLQRASLENDLRQGLLKREFILYFQPQVDEDNRLLGAEVLLRWLHPVRGLLAPGEIIPVAEGSGLILPLGEWVLQSACQTLALWAKQPQWRHLTLSVNVSVKQLQQPDFVEQVLRTLEICGTDPRRLKLEITESMLLDGRAAVIDKMVRLKAHGVRFSLDDFGTGYSSLSYLKNLPLDQLKIDRSFVCDLLCDPLDADIARTIVSLAHALHLEVIAEGVENLEQCERLSSFGCTLFQGYYFGRPMPVEGLLAGERLLLE